MSLLNPSELTFADQIHSISFANPFQQRRVDLEREALGDDYVKFGFAKVYQPGEGPNPNTALLLAKAEQLLLRMQSKATREAVAEQDRVAAADLALYILYHRHIHGLYQLAAKAGLPQKSGRLKVSWFDQFESDAESLLQLGEERLRHEEDAASLFALFFQMARAFENIFAKFIGRSQAAIALRASMWESIFTHDLARYWRRLQSGLRNAAENDSIASLTSDIPTLITGPSGTGKELVAQAIGRSGFLRFQPKSSSFELDDAALFRPIHLAALSPALIESELFGHRRGAFTGALEDRASFLETCAPYGSVFLDEIAEIDATLQVKLLRVLQTREFNRLGDAQLRRFSGRLVSATNRDLGAEIQAGRFREDLYYRLNADRLVTPSLHELLGGGGRELEHLVGFVASGLLPTEKGNGEDQAMFASELCTWIEQHLGLDYGWPGNFRELEQCARAFLIRGHYAPQDRQSNPSENVSKERHAGWLQQAENCGLSADELLSAYCEQAYRSAGTYEGAAKKIGLDRRTIRARVQAHRDATDEPA